MLELAAGLPQRALDGIALGSRQLRADLGSSSHAPPSQGDEMLEILAQGLLQTALDAGTFLLLLGA